MKKYVWVEGVDRALQITEQLGFTLPERALLLGLEGEVGQNPEYLRHQLIYIGRGTAVKMRCDAIIALDAVLRKIGRTDAASKREFIENERYQALNDETTKTWIKGGELTRLEYAVEQLRYMST